jgi:hypothetical protein
MTRTKLVLLSAVCAVAAAICTPALALNPQPLPPLQSGPVTHGSGGHIGSPHHGIR